MPNSLRCKIKKFHYQGKLSDAEKDRLLDALDVAERQTGHWIIRKSPDKYHCDMMKCSECGFDDVADDEYKFCPKCGADMRGKKNGE